MKKIVLFSVLAIAIIFILLTLVVPAKIGHVVYEAVTDLESQIYGLNQTEVDIGEMKISLYQNQQPDKPTILMLHGFSGDKDNWIRFARYFVDDFNVVIPDLAGHGETGFKETWSYRSPAQAERLLKLMDALKIDKVHIIGNSMGGSIAAHFAKQYPQRTLSLALVDPAGVRSPQSSAMGKMLEQGNNPFIINNRMEFDAFYAMTMSNPPFIPDFIFAAISEKYQQRQQQLKTMFADFHDKDLLDSSLTSIKAPTLLLWGEDDQLLDVSSTEVWKAGIANLQLKIWPAIGHMPMLEIPHESAQVYLKFLDSID